MLIQLLLTEYPEAIKIPLKNNERYPLQIACRFEKSVAAIRLLVTNFPKAVEISDCYQWCPFHLVCRIANQEYESLIHFLHTLYPYAIQRQTHDWKYPLHIACHSNQSMTVIQFLITIDPTATRLRDRYKEWYPLHYACAYSSNESVVQLLIATYPEALEKANSCGLYPLHLACQSYHQSTQVIHNLLTAYPNAIRCQDKYESYPLHYACQSKNESKLSESIIELLYQNYPEAAYVTNQYGFNPNNLHFSKRRFEIYTWLILLQY